MVSRETKVVAAQAVFVAAVFVGFRVESISNVLVLGITIAVGLVGVVLMHRYLEA